MSVFTKSKVSNSNTGIPCNWPKIQGVGRSMEIWMCGWRRKFRGFCYDDKQLQTQNSFHASQLSFKWFTLKKFFKVFVLFSLSGALQDFLPITLKRYKACQEGQGIKGLTFMLWYLNLFPWNSHPRTCLQANLHFGHILRTWLQEPLCKLTPHVVLIGAVGSLRRKAGDWMGMEA